MMLADCSPALAAKRNIFNDVTDALDEAPPPLTCRVLWMYASLWSNLGRCDKYAFCAVFSAIAPDWTNAEVSKQNQTKKKTTLERAKTTIGVFRLLKPCC